MSQRTNGLRQVLSSPSVYIGLQNLLGGRRARRWLAQEYFDLDNVQRILDIGCGTADILEFLPVHVEYVGFDASVPYIEYAKSRYANRKARFRANLVGQNDAEIDGRFDLVLAMGILHHLDDEPAAELFGTASAALGSQGRLFTLDPCFQTNQSKFSERLVSSDRGQNVRRPEEYQALAEQYFSNVEVHHHNNLLRVPYDHAVLIGQN